MGQKKGFNVIVTALSGIDGSVQTTNGHGYTEKQSACKHASFVNMAAISLSLATAWKRQRGSNNVGATTRKRQRGKRQRGSDK